MTEYAIVTTGGWIDDDFALRFLLKQLPESRFGRAGCPAGEEDADHILLIASDRGLLFLDRHRIVPDLIVGDFDSVPETYIAQYLCGHPGVEMHAYSWEKDYTDTEIAARAAVERGCRRIDFLGATGSRFDHMLSNVQILAMLLEQGIIGRILDPCNRITVHRESFRIRKADQWGKYVSFFAWGGDVHNLTLTGFHFPMKGGTVTADSSRTVSNQIEEEYAEVTFADGTLLMVESKDSTAGEVP